MDSKPLKNQEKMPVVQSNPLVNASYKLDLNEQKILRYLISMIKPETEKFKGYYYRIYLKDLKEYLRWEGDYPGLLKYVKNIARNLKNTHIKVIKPDTVIETSWISSYEYPKSPGEEGWIEFEISSKLESELLKLKDQFTKYYLKNISRLSSQYSIRIYELLKQVVNLGRREFSLEEFKNILGIEKEYKLTRDLKKRVLSVAHKDIVSKTDIDYKWQFRKEGRRIKGIIFYDIQQKTQIPASIMTLIPKKYRENKQLLDLVRKYIELCGEEYVIEKLNYTNSKNPERYLDYLYRCLEENWGAGFIPGQRPLPGILESIEDGTVFEIGGERYIFEGGFVKIKDRVIPEGYLRQMLAEGKARIVQEEQPD